jgi:hypothetical protein
VFESRKGLQLKRVWLKRRWKGRADAFEEAAQLARRRICPKRLASGGRIRNVIRPPRFFCRRARSVFRAVSVPAIVNTLAWHNVILTQTDEKMDATKMRVGAACERAGRSQRDFCGASALSQAVGICPAWNGNFIGGAHNDWRIESV